MTVHSSSRRRGRRKRPPMRNLPRRRWRWRCRERRMSVIERQKALPKIWKFKRFHNTLQKLSGRGSRRSRRRIYKRRRRRGCRSIHKNRHKQHIDSDNRRRQRRRRSRLRSRWRTYGIWRKRRKHYYKQFRFI